MAARLALHVQKDAACMEKDCPYARHAVAMMLHDPVRPRELGASGRAPVRPSPVQRVVEGGRHVLATSNAPLGKLLLVAAEVRPLHCPVLLLLLLLLQLRGQWRYALRCSTRILSSSRPAPTAAVSSTVLHQQTTAIDTVRRRDRQTGSSQHAPASPAHDTHTRTAWLPMTSSPSTPCGQATARLPRWRDRVSTTAILPVPPLPGPRRTS
ncbi:hypothetical protein BT67DRAFT_213310 [Trichocladium antarcticum]|uniref:Uncharacterized protein n=1 Tax=Trichocladium antarcticum TaxID=1450529 RepID=A0AAN6ZAC5_9PEZI|nr:hypothetical protein BT67DRAFT_213310 [Trichocladium antarcticum]